MHLRRLFQFRESFTPALTTIVLVLSLSITGCESGKALFQGGQVDWNRYYSNAETNAIMQHYARKYPYLTRLFSIGKSYLGVDLMVMEVTSFGKRSSAEKPGFYVDGNIHSGELTGSAVTLYLMGYLLDRYGEDPEITHLLDTRVFYLRPKFNPDGADLALLKDVSLRSTVHPVDSDDDGRVDEDPAEDLNGDGFITRMRIPDPEGNMMVSGDDPRLMVRRGREVTEGSFFRVVSEGIDNDHDGRLNEDDVGGIDMNRNFPRNWEPEYLQPGAGAFPLSEPETYATVKFINEHPNITGIVHNHTSGGFVYRLPSATDPARFDPADIELIVTLGERYTETTGRGVEPSSTHPVNHRYGTLISWAYWDRGIIGWVPEYWPGITADYNGDGRTDEVERLRFNDEELGSRYFVDWEPYEHPEYGSIEIGGWRQKFISQNPPAELLEEECALQMPWILWLAGQSPLLEMTEPTVTQLGDNRFSIEVTVTNTGYLPTNLTERGIEAGVVNQVIATIILADVLYPEGCELVEGGHRISLGHLSGSWSVTAEDHSNSASAAWVVRKNDSYAQIRITASSDTGGSVSSEITP
ncbi:M14 family metallopeptidase [Candidatus Zixiibacteriota bacterium]